MWFTFLKMFAFLFHFSCDDWKFAGLTTINPRAVELDEIKMAASIRAMQQVSPEQEKSFGLWTHKKGSPLYTRKLLLCLTKLQNYFCTRVETWWWRLSWIHSGPHRGLAEGSTRLPKSCLNCGEFGFPTRTWRASFKCTVFASVHSLFFLPK